MEDGTRRLLPLLDLVMNIETDTEIPGYTGND
jgi:hypothetical protein